MKSGNGLFKLLLLGSVLLVGEATLANKGKPMPITNLKKSVEVVTSLYDSLPPNKNTPENVADVKKLPVVKEVPKSKKQVVPISVPLTVKSVKPIKVIKPKIIKPIIKIN